MGTPDSPGGRERATTAAAYLMLFVLGVFQGLIGSFQYSQSPAPLIAIVLAVVIFATCVAGGWGMGTFSGGLVPAVGWIVASFIVAMQRPNGSVIITATAAGEWYLYGGALGCVIGSAAAFFIRIRRPAPPHGSVQAPVPGRRSR